MRDEPDYLQDMSGRCRTLRSSIHSASERRAYYDVISGMQREGRRQRREEERQQAEAQKAAQEQDARRAQQCAESRRILAAKNARTDLTPGELNDLHRFEDNITARCTKI